jgi:hypothetical protein
MRRFLFVLALVAATCSSPTGPGKSPETSGEGGGPQIVFGGDERGYLEPCGCNRPMLGGLARKATAAHGAPLLENGNLVDKPGRLQEIKYESFLTALSEMNCVALNVGPGDLELGIDFLRSAAGMARFPVISANLLEGGGQVFPSYAEFTVGDEVCRAIGVMEPGPGVKAELRSVKQTVKVLVEDAPAHVRIFLLYQGSAKGARDLLETHRRIEAAVYSQPGGEPRVRSASLFSPGDRGRWVVRFGFQPRIVPLGPKLRPDQRMVKALGRYVSRLTEEDLLHRMNAGAPPDSGGYVGDSVCATCHGGAFDVHASSKHARAIESLRRTGRHVDPDCVRCHVIGYGEATGFTALDETPEMARVGCESCHGPGKDHTENPGEPTRRNAKASCRTCHTEDTDPGFVYTDKWRRIRH